MPISPMQYEYVTRKEFNELSLKMDDGFEKVFDYSENVERSLEEFREETKKNFREVRSDISQLKSDVGQLKTDVSELKSDVAMLKSDVSQLKSDVSELKSDVSGVELGVGSLRQNMIDGFNKVFDLISQTMTLIVQNQSH